MPSTRIWARCSIVVGYLLVAAGAVVQLVQFLTENGHGTEYNEGVVAFLSRSLMELVLPVAFLLLIKIKASDASQARNMRLAFTAFAIAAFFTMLEGLMYGLVYVSFPVSSSSLTWLETSYFLVAGGGFVLIAGFALVASMSTFAPPEPESASDSTPEPPSDLEVVGADG